MGKIYTDATAALAGLLRDGMTIMSGGFGICGIPRVLIEAIRESGREGPHRRPRTMRASTMRARPAAADAAVSKMISSYVGENATFAKQYLAGELAIEFNPQGTLAERIRAGGAGIPAFFTKTGYGTAVAEGKETREFDGETYVMERGLFADLAIVHAYRATTRATSSTGRRRELQPDHGHRRKVTVRRSSIWSARRIDPTTSTPPASS
jgi:3-oxoacid CoA-transferase subunit A